MSSIPIRFRQTLGDGTYHYWGFINGGFSAPANHVAMTRKSYLTMADIEKRSDMFTGVKDAKGKDIYERDILRLHDRIEYVVRWKDGSWVASNKNGTDVLLYSISESGEVVGTK